MVTTNQSAGRSAVKVYAPGEPGLWAVIFIELVLFAFYDRLFGCSIPLVELILWIGVFFGSVTRGLYREVRDHRVKQDLLASEEQRTDREQSVVMA